MLQLQKSKILTFFAHPDDEVLAAGGTLNRLSNEGSEIHVAIPATGIHARRNKKDKETRDKELIELRENCEKALSFIGIEKIYFGEFPDNEMDKHSLLEIIHWFEKIINKVQPDLIFTHHRYCTNIDHQICHNAAVVATRPSFESHIDLIFGEVPSSTGYLKPVQWEPNLYIEISTLNIAAKIKAMETYKGESRPDPHPRSRENLWSLAKVRGSESGFHFAESFISRINISI